MTILHVWAVFIVFGATGGIGSDLVAQLLRLSGSHVVAAARNEDKVLQLLDRLSAKERLSHAVYDAASSKSVCPLCWCGYVVL